GVSYSIAAVITLAVTVLVAARAGGRWLVPVLLVSAGLALLAAGRLAFVGLLLRDRYATGGGLDLFWVLGFGLLAAAALWPPATGCWSGWPSGWPPPSARTTWSPGSAATSSRCWSRRSPPAPGCGPPAGCWTRCPRRSSSPAGRSG